MKTRTLVTRCAVLSVAFAAVALGAFAATAQARFPLPRPCVCPMIYAPVICSNGVIYDNSCFASCEGATGCVPYEDWF